MGFLPSEGTSKTWVALFQPPFFPWLPSSPTVLGTGPRGKWALPEAPQGPAPKIPGDGVHRLTEGRNKGATVSQRTLLLL